MESNRIIPKVGLKLKPIHDAIDWPEEEAEILKEGTDSNEGKWYVMEAGNFGAWLTEEEINKDYIELKK